jgi:hypothetical protein
MVSQNKSIVISDPFSAGGAAPSSAALDVDDAAGKAHQGRGKGRAPIPADHLPDGGGGGARDCPQGQGVNEK